MIKLNLSVRGGGCIILCFFLSSCIIDVYDELNENPFEPLVLHEGDVAVYTGQEINLMYEGSSCQWYETTSADTDNGFAILGATANTLTIKNIPEKSVKYFYCKSVLDGGDRKTSSPFTVANTGLVQLRIETLGGEEPTCKKSNPPADWYWGKSIKNATKVPSRVIMMKGTHKLYDSGDYAENESGATIKIRGNTSARVGMRTGKLPYKIKLEEKADLLKYSRPDRKKHKDKDWILLNTSKINTKIGFLVSELCGVNYVPACDVVDVVINGIYRGSYILTEAVEESANRIALDESGYLIERDPYYWNEDLYFSTPDSFNAVVNYTFKYPSSSLLSPDNENFLYIQDYVRETYASIEIGSYESYIDVDSFSAWILAHDILGTSDYAGSNIFISKYDSNLSPLRMECPWDFDSIFNRQSAFASIHVMDMFWFNALFSSENKIFLDSYKKKYSQVRESVLEKTKKELKVFLTNYAERIDIARKLEQDIYGFEWEHVSAEISHAESWFESQILWLDSAINALQ